MSNVGMPPLFGAALVLTLAGTTAQAAPLHAAAPGQDRVVQQAHDIYVDGYHRHRHHHGHVHGNPYRPHLDCSRHGYHEHCQVHVPRRRHYHDHYRYDGYGYGHGYRRHHYDDDYGYTYRRYRYY